MPMTWHIFGQHDHSCAIFVARDSSDYTGKFASVMAEDHVPGRTLALLYVAADDVEPLGIRLRSRLDGVLVFRRASAHAYPRQSWTGEGSRRLAPEFPVGLVDAGRASRRRRVHTSFLFVMGVMRRMLPGATATE